MWNTHWNPQSQNLSYLVWQDEIYLLLNHLSTCLLSQLSLEVHSYITELGTLLFLYTLKTFSRTTLEVGGRVLADERPHFLANGCRIRGLIIKDLSNNIPAAKAKG